METSQIRSHRAYAALILCAVIFTGCATQPPIYYWGHYEELVYTTYAKPGSLAPEDQILKLEEDYQHVRSTNGRVPPGWHAHLGYLYYQAGKLDQAKQELETEKAEFPESKVFVDRLLANIKGS